MDADCCLFDVLSRIAVHLLEVNGIFHPLVRLACFGNSFVKRKHACKTPSSIPPSFLIYLFIHLFIRERIENSAWILFLSRNRHQEPVGLSFFRRYCSTTLT